MGTLQLIKKKHTHPETNFLPFTGILKNITHTHAHRLVARAGSTDIPDPLSPLLPIVHRPR